MSLKPGTQKLVFGDLKVVCHGAVHEQEHSQSISTVSTSHLSNEMPETAKSAREISHSFFSETNDSSDAKDCLIDQLRLELKDLKL